ncbi:MAG: GTPase HflX [Lachnospiraceae bacterium]|nr:GTPase HflX [Lachnospiraceae bacterium]
MTDTKNISETRNAALVGLSLSRSNAKFEKSLKETEALAEAAGLSVSALFTQSLPKPNTGYYIGSGKIEEIKAYLAMTGTDLVIFESQLTPMQQRNLSNAFDCEVLDRTALILMIFADRARTREATLQVDYARLQYLLPRLAGMHDDLGRQAGASGAMSNKGAGEKKIELDRRRIEQKMAELRRALDEVDRERATQRKARMRSGLSKVSLVGYTNAGKSTILNGMLRLYGTDSDKQVFEKDMLFATLDTSVRRIDPGEGKKPFLLSDTVGFIDNLPTTLIKAFRSTLEETKYADLLLIVSDVSDPDYRENLSVTIRTLEEIGAGGIPRIYVFNKADRLTEPHGDFISVPGMAPEDGRITMCAKSGEDIKKLCDLTGRHLSAGRTLCTLLIPYDKGGLLSALMKDSDVTILSYADEGTKVEAHLKKEDVERLGRYVTTGTDPV